MSRVERFRSSVDQSEEAPPLSDTKQDTYDHPVFKRLLSASGMASLGSLPVFLAGAQSMLVQADFPFSERELGFAVSLFYTTSALMAAPIGYFIDRHGVRLGGGLAGAVSALSMLSIAFLAQSAAGLTAMLAVAGIANAGLQMTTNAALATQVPHERQGLAFGIKQSAVPFAILVGGAAVPTVSLLVGWRWTFGAVSALGLLVIARASHAPRPPRASPLRRRTPKSQQTTTAPIALAGVATAFANGAATSLAAFLPAWTFALGMDAGKSGILLALGAGMSIGGRILAGLHVDRHDRGILKILGAQLAIGALSLLAIASGHIGLITVCTLTAFTFGWSWPGLLLLTAVRLGRKSPATASSSVQAGGFVGGAFGPVLFGWIAEHSSYGSAWIFASVLMVVAGGLVLAIQKQIPPRTLELNQD